MHEPDDWPPRRQGSGGEAAAWIVSGIIALILAGGAIYLNSITPGGWATSPLTPPSWVQSK